MTSCSAKSKRQCIRQQPQKKSESGPNDNDLIIASGCSKTIDNIGLDVLSKCLLFLSLPDVHSASLVCIEWRNAIWQSDPLWENLLVQKYASHADLPEGWCTSGRNEYFRRVSLMKCQYAPVRNLAGLPIPLQRKTPGSELMQRWKPDAIIFMVDIFTGRHHFDDDIPHYENESDQKKRLGPQIPIYSSCFRVSSTNNGAASVDDNDTLCRLTLDEEEIRVYEEMQISPECEQGKAVLEAIENFHDVTFGNDTLTGCLRDVGGLYVEMSYYVEGCNVPKCEPITLLSEHHTFFVDSFDNGKTTYRSDIKPAWLPGRRDWNSSESMCEKADALQRGRVLNRQTSKYGSVPLPFDPEVELRFSPPGERSMHHHWEFENDSREEYSISVNVGFSIGEDYDCHFANLVVPPLLSLWNDAARQKERKSFQRCI
mmetsp:Transcript_31122/g.56464  ORF Transcript_31122/g.56464 Transcript_31122/m.56464 type:complete len:428 (-) Transcript_31122:111-1394(-)|eukprot:CAMPEP_0201917366 /NCGR_PEP_ID=MMETSP0903-20130614/6772_1 /ASSEMBLY_ACC=CAM_ASM_000552 /TAXON_ID=420261 /ORGANISM="Thalassiosira antarctica, Strain CCMP982" /LENGTH=427 /DNA_ID=CAMNT_0048453413 /DNA_START=106 /DNA_END=1389 /DNA_ORIENTATION=-